jgi:hydroxymethylbilane synthase
MTRPTLRIATRKSPLAMWQAEHVANTLQTIHPDLQIDILGITTQGDKILDTPLAKIGGKGLFVKELEHRILQGDADIAVHSMKDVPATLPDGLHLAVIMQREEPRDAFVSPHYGSLKALPEGARVGTSSLRRECQLRCRYPNLHILPLRGNVNTRLRKLDDGEYDAIILAGAGLIRLGMQERIRHLIEPDDSLPAIGQGALGIECRAEDQRINALLTPLHDADTACCVLAERAMNKRLEGGCQAPIGGYAVLQDQRIWLRGLVGSVDGTEVVRAETYGECDEAEQLGMNLADDLRHQGGAKILETLYAAGE